MWYLKNLDLPGKTPMYWLGGIRSPHVFVHREGPSMFHVSNNPTFLEYAVFSIHLDESLLVQPESLFSTTVQITRHSSYPIYLQFPQGNSAEEPMGYPFNLKPFVPTRLVEGVLIGFNLPGKWWRLEHHPIICYAPTLPTQQYDQLCEYGLQCGFQISQEPNYLATFMVVENFSAYNREHMEKLALD